MEQARSGRSPSAQLGKRLQVIGATTALIVALVWTAGLIARTVLLGSNEDVMRQRVERAVRQAFADQIDVSHERAVAVASLPSIRPAVTGDLAALRGVFDALAALGGRSTDTESTTVYSQDGVPLAWVGGPSEVPVERVRSGREDWFVVEGALGLHLVHVWPVEGVGATVVTERDVAAAPAPALVSLRDSRADRYRISTRWGPVSLEVSSRSARTTPDPSRFDINGPGDRPLVTAVVEEADLQRTRAQWAGAVRSLAWAAVAVAALLCAAATLDWRALTVASRPGPAGAGLLLSLAAARAILLVEPLGNWSSGPLATGVTYASASVPRLLSSPLDFLLTALWVAGSMLVVLQWVETSRRLRSSRRRVETPAEWARFLLGTAMAGIASAALLFGYGWLLRDTVANSTLDLLHLSLAPLSAPRLALQLGLVLSHAAVVGAGVAFCRASTSPWLLPRRWPGHAVAATAWILPAVALLVTTAAPGRPLLPVTALALIVVLALGAPALWARYRNGTQAFRLLAVALALILPALAFYPTVFATAWRAKSDLVETRYAPQTISQRGTVYALLEESLRDIDAVPGLTELVAAPRTADESAAPTDRAFEVWGSTALARDLVTSSVEVYGKDGGLLSRFAFNLPEDLSAVPRSDEASCRWTVAEEVAPFFAEERRVYHAGRAICGGPDGPVSGSIVVHAMLDYENLPFTASRAPYVQLLQPTDAVVGPDTPGDDLQYAVYGWSRTPLYSSHETAWPLDDAVFSLVEQSRAPVWATLRRNGEPFDVYLLNDRGGIYALGFPAVSAFGHAVNLAELTTLAAVAFLGVTLAVGLFGFASRRIVPARALLREIRASFYRKLFLAFVAAVVAPVALLAVVARTFVANEMRDGVEREALRTSAAASRVVADLIAPQAAQQGSAVDDNLMVWVRRLIDEDANIFAGTNLQATSERTVFAAGLLSSRTPADIYRAVTLRREGGAVARERIGSFEYVVAAAPIRLGSVDAVMTVPLTTRQRDIDLQIDALDRRVLLAALVFILAGAGLGYTMAERIADPVSRLTRATRRIAGGDFDVRVASASSDELAKLVADFNQMAAELQRQRGELERTNRLEAWAEMARQVAHDIKNPLTPIQLNAEHLRRVHTDRGEPLGSIVKDCVDTILAQVALLRQISSEFSNFASSPSVRRTVVDTAELVAELVAPYERGLPEGTSIHVGATAHLPPVAVDRGLVARSLTNVIENALHAMPNGGRLSIDAAVRDDMVAISISDTGAGMDPEALERAFEPYFSTKARGTGLGLPIAKRNVELSGGSIAISSQRDRGTTVEVRLPIATQRP